MPTDQLLATLRTTPNRGDTHVFLGDPLSDAADKTTVEPGNGFSPGVWTCGISVWVEAEGQLYSPDLFPAELEWGFPDWDALPPVLEARFPAGDSITVSSRLGHLGGEGAEGADFLQVVVSAVLPGAGTLFLVIRDVGPAGGRVSSAAWNAHDSCLLLNGNLRLTAENPPAQCHIIPPGDGCDSYLAILEYDLALEAGQTLTLAFKTEHAFSDRAFGTEVPLLRPFAGVSVAAGLVRSHGEWQQMLPACVFAPDPRIARVWERSAYHLLANMECGLPRIGAVNYPAWWMRDCVLALRAVDLIGRHDLARIGADHVAPLIFAGGFGAESDAPGEGIWALVRHAVMTGDDEWLARVFPHIERRVDWLHRMLTATVPIRAVAENRLPMYITNPANSIVCLPAENGLVRGRMDWHAPDFYINCWVHCGFAEAALAARRLEHDDLAEQWTAEAARLDDAIAEHLLPHYDNERDPVVTPHPTGALAGHREALRAKLGDWYRRNRLTPEGTRNPEKLWTYFEAGQIHNAMRLGLRDEAWVSLNGMLDDGAPWGVSAYNEGLPGDNEFLPYRNTAGMRGWLQPERAQAGNMPHLWTAAEMIALIREMFVREENGVLVLGTGVPAGWLMPGAHFGVDAMPTDFGPVTYSVTVGWDGEIGLQYSGPEAYRCAWEAK